ncbi:Carboxy-terminal processing protease [Fulvivirga imtechensis AK7]|uniref:Carboxy-terminal processing protease n=1 Tax=Fulvivirga imtechensis AK7 TaxID=1237149 RepID=L8K0Z1_9BACT|nr:S41 family peptidase [Fulvivirga imtechensis]ELR73589.1 Carboxy-terminal processing protease [Fulvivirga imtechensis AK7]
MSFSSKKIKIWGLSSLLLVVVFAFTSPADRYFEIAKNLDIFATLFKEVNALYVDEVNPNKVIKTGIDAMLASLDPYTNYIPEDDIEDFRTQSTGQYGGIGAVTSRVDGKIRVVMLMEGYSAEKNGLKIGDEVIKIDNIDVRGMSREATSDLMKGQANSPVSLTVIRYGSASPITLNFKREKVKISNVPYYGMVTNNIGYIKLSDFTMQAGKEVKNAVIALKDKGAEKVILDLRGNPGGLLLEAVNITNVFLPKGLDVVSTKGKLAENNATYKTLNSPVDIGIPLAVLVNSGSASASEIVAGTVQDYDRGVIIGEKSFGKGLVQITRPLSYNAQLKVTTAKYYTPSGRCIQALDYTFRRGDGSVGKIPDSLKSEFKTSNGRKVLDGGGIDPDVNTKQEALSPIAYSLLSKGLIFDYATKYHYEHPSIPEAKVFGLSNAEYEEFKKWLKDKDYSYDTEVEATLKKLKETAKKEKYFKDIEAHIKGVEETLISSKENDLNAFKDQVLTLLEDEIASRYYLERGSIESTFDSDKTILEAIEVLNNKDRYNQILSAAR